MHRLLYKGIVAAALAEDLWSGDRTTDSILLYESGEAEIVAKDEGILAGVAVAKEVFAQIDERILFHAAMRDGDPLRQGDRLVLLQGPLAGILTGERVALNFLQHMSGISTATSRAVENIRGTGARIVDTRKTTPGLRVLEKYAVRIGGGENHRLSLSDMILIKDNHIRCAGSITEAVARVRRQCSFTVKIEVETTTLTEVHEALMSGVEVIMLDNMTPEMMLEAVRLIAGRALVEASGGITPDRIKDVASTGVDLLSLGYLTHNVRSLDLSLKVI